MANDTLLNLELPGIKKLPPAARSAKSSTSAMRSCSSPVTASRRSIAWMPNGIPRKGEVLTQISHFWFDQTEQLVPNHRIVKAGESFNVPALAHIPAETKAALAKRAMIVKKAQPLAVECIVRGYPAGSGWREVANGLGSPLPAGLQESSELPEPIFTPSTKAETGHDENIASDEAKKILGAPTSPIKRAT